MAPEGNITNSPAPFDHLGGVGEPLPFPKTFHFIWFGELPPNMASYIETWIERHPDWKFKRWNYHNLPKLRNQQIFDQALEIAGEPGCYQLMSDILRYEILEEEGGIYVDCDFECKQSIDDLIRGKTGFAAWEVQGTWLNNAFMGVVPKHPLMTQLIDGLAESVALRQPASRPNAYSGPQYFTPIALGFASMMTFFPQSWFYPYAFNELHRGKETFENAYAVHHWNNQRRKRGLVEA